MEKKRKNNITIDSANFHPRKPLKHLNPEYQAILWPEHLSGTTRGGWYGSQGTKTPQRSVLRKSYQRMRQD